MWCPVCRQDVPAIAADERQLECARCRSPLDARAGGGTRTTPPANSAGLTPDELTLLARQQSELDDILARAERLLGIEATTERPTARRAFVTGFHSPHSAPERHHFSHRESDSPRFGHSRVTVLSWCALAVAMTGFVCGGILLAWSLVFNRADLWNVGETVTLASQVGLLIGLILQLDRLGHERSQTVNRLTLLDERVESLRSQSAIWSERKLRADQKESVTESALADLKTQLDVLAAKLVDKRSA